MEMLGAAQAAGSTQEAAPAAVPKDPVRIERSLRGAQKRRANIANRLNTIVDRYPAMSQHTLLTLGEIAVVKSWSLSTVWRRIADGRLKVVKNGGMVRATKRDVERMF